MVKNINLALVSGGSLVVLEGNGSVGDGGFDSVDSSRDLHGLGDLNLRHGILLRFSSLSSRNRIELRIKKSNKKYQNVGITLTFPVAKSKIS